MIKLVRPEKPEELTDDKVRELTNKFIKDKTKAVWRENYIVESLNNMSHNKCCYCEILLTEQSREMHVEHFHYKDKYFNEVVMWDNLLPSCRQCNSNKGTTDTKSEPMIDPTKDNPKEYLYLNMYMIKSKDNSVNSKGKNTVEILELNNRERLVNPRIKISCRLDEKLNLLLEIANEYKNGQNILTRRKNRIVNGVKDILRMAQTDQEFSAFMSTVILNNDDYIELANVLKDLGLWDDELQTLHNNSNELKFDTSK